MFPASSAFTYASAKLKLIYQTFPLVTVSPESTFAVVVAISALAEVAEVLQTL
jgi:tagatose-1,6-bisphosphate aldolase non-catalytic subunit AgaZ/GatZ